MGLGDFTSDDNTDIKGLEQRVRGKIEEHGYSAKKVREEGISGNTWELDAVAYSSDGSPVAYFEVKDASEDIAKQTYRNHMTRAVAELIDFREEGIPGAVVVPQKREFGNKDWDALFESINCTLIEERELPEFLSRLD
ncbi:hypothetical protein [Halorubrum sp. DTA46]|uniref:hypothetical protein n=1 Tax=Halorubrum sp. DTA46 TaxID=3402162 RepID=UPI003AADF589